MNICLQKKWQKERKRYEDQSFFTYSWLNKYVFNLIILSFVILILVSTSFNIFFDDIKAIYLLVFAGIFLVFTILCSLVSFVFYSKACRYEMNILDDHYLQGAELKGWSNSFLNDFERYQLLSIIFIVLNKVCELVFIYVNLVKLS